MKIKIFLDGADRNSMIEFASNPLVKGFTTNPSLMKKAGVTDYKGYALEILPRLAGKPVSFEVFADDFPEMKRQALEIAKWSPTIYVKIPITNSKGESCIPLIRELTAARVRLNVTAIYTLEQVRQTCDAVKGGPGAFISVFAGRIADTGVDPMPLMRESVLLCGAAGPEVELLWASTREAFNVVQADSIGCSIITAPADVIKKVSGFGKDLVKLSLETVQAFKADAEAAGFRL